MKTLSRLTIILVALALVLTSCSGPRAAISSANPESVSGILITPDPSATATPTPFQPGGISPSTGKDGATAAPRSTRTPVNTPTPSATATPEGMPYPPVPKLDVPEGTVNILLLGSDWRPNAGFRTDVIMLVSLNRAKGTASVISFPRDLYVWLPDRGMQRINTAQAFGGFELTQDTFEYNFGIRPDYYLMTNFQGFMQIVDSLGGINVYASRSLSDRCDLENDLNEDGWCNIEPGWHHMDGETALWYVRSRKSTSDFDRTRRAQEVIQGVFNGLMSLNAINRIPELYRAYSANTETNIGLDTIVSLAPMAPDIFSGNIEVKRYAVGYEHVTGWTTPAGGSVLLPHVEEIQELIQTALNGVN